SFPKPDVLVVAAGRIALPDDARLPSQLDRSDVSLLKHRYVYLNKGVPLRRGRPVSQAFQQGQLRLDRPNNGVRQPRQIAGAYDSYKSEIGFVGGAAWGVDDQDAGLRLRPQYPILLFEESSGYLQ